MTQKKGYTVSRNENETLSVFIKATGLGYEAKYWYVRKDAETIIEYRSQHFHGKNKHDAVYRTLKFAESELSERKVRKVQELLQNAWSLLEPIL